MVHAQENELIETSEIAGQMMVEVERDPTRPIKRIYNEVVQRDQVEKEHIPEYNNVKSKLQRKRASLMPPTPGEIQDVEIVGEWERTWTDRQFLSHQDNDWGLLVFATNQTLGICNNVRMCTLMELLKPAHNHMSNL